MTIKEGRATLTDTQLSVNIIASIKEYATLSKKVAQAEKAISQELAALSSKRKALTGIKSSIRGWILKHTEDRFKVNKWIAEIVRTDKIGTVDKEAVLMKFLDELKPQQQQLYKDMMEAAKDALEVKETISFSITADSITEEQDKNILRQQVSDLIQSTKEFGNSVNEYSLIVDQLPEIPEM